MKHMKRLSTAESYDSEGAYDTIHGMGIRLFAVVLCLLCNTPTWSQGCTFGSADAFDATAKALSQAPSCRAAATKMHDCAWGSSADAQLAPIATAKCEGDFLSKLSKAGKDRYFQEMQLCSYRFAKQEGTISISAAALCQLDVAESFSDNRAKEDRPPSRASFDCSRASTPLETLICSDKELGSADIVLSRVYSGAVKSIGKDHQAAIIEAQRQWLQTVTSTCRRAKSLLSSDCVRDNFEQRFSDLDGCGDADGGDADAVLTCLKDVNSEEMKTPKIASDYKPRASFDCGNPKTALEIVICADSELGETDIKLAQTYAAANSKIGTSRQKDLVQSERSWLAYVNKTCPLGAVGGIPPIMTRGCVRNAFETRIEQLKTCPDNSDPQQRLGCLNDFHLFKEN
jgi:uncharacterized protein